MKHKAHLLLPVIVLISLVITACKGSSVDNSNGSTTSQSAASLSEVNALLVGTLKLEGTENAITAEEAGQLLPLWQAYLSLSRSQTAAEEEVNGLLKQIQSSMTSQQTQAIKAMNLTNDDMLQLMQSMGPVGSQGTPNPQGTPGADFPGGFFQGGNFPDDAQPPSGSTGGTSGNRPSGRGGMPGGGPMVFQSGPGMGGDTGSVTGGQGLQGTADPSMQATAQARFSTQASQVNTMLLSVLINKLQALTAAG